MAQERLVSLLSSNSNLRSQVASLDAAIDTLKANGMDEQADMFRANLQQSIANKDIDSLKAYSSQLMAMNSKNMSVPVEQRGKAKPQEEVVPQEELIANLNMLIGTADENNIDLPDAQLKQIAQLAQSNSPRLGKQIAGLESTINDLLKISREETKTLTTLQDGRQVLRGDKTGTYYQGGSPISRGAINASKLNEMAFEPARQAAGGVPILPPQIVEAAVQGRPEVYSTPEVVNDNKKLNAIKAARAIYETGDVRGATDMLNSIGMANMLPGPLAPDDVKAYFDAGADMPSEVPEAESKETTAIPKREKGESYTDYQKRIASKK